MRGKAFKTITLKPLTGPMNPVRSADELLPGEFSWKENLEIDKNGHLSRRAGFDQFQSIDRSDVVAMHEVTTTDGVRRLVSAARDGSVALLSSSGDQWSDIGGTFQDADEWSFASVGNVLLVSDGVGSVHYANLPNGSLEPVGELVNTLEVSGVQVMVSFSGCVFLMNTYEGGFRYGSRVRWSALNEPTRFVSDTDNIAGFQDLPMDQRILAAGVLGDRLIIYTDSAIWSCRATGGSGVFGFTQLYSDPVARSRCLVHSKTLVSIGASHVYVGQDGVYAFSSFQREPTRLSWLDQAARIIFDPSSPYALSRAQCRMVAGFYSDTQELWLSWVGADGHHTLVANIMYKTCDYDGTGWDAFASHARADQTSFGDWLDQYVPNDDADWFDTGNSSYRELCSVYLKDLCVGCSDNPLFIGSLRYKEGSGDGRLKQISHRVDGSRILGRDIYGSVEGYTSILRGVVPAGNDEHDKVLRRFVVEVLSTANTSRNVRLRLRVGVSQQAYQPSLSGTDYQGIQWHEQPLKTLGPDPSGKTLEEADSGTLLRTTPVEWNLHERGRFIYWELSIVGSDGGDTVLLDTLSFTRLDMEVRLVPKK